MTATATLSSAELTRHIADVGGRLEAAQSSLPAALRNAATAFLHGRENDGPKSVRAEIRVLQDLIAGLRQLNVRAEHDDLNAEIERREREYEAESARLEVLRSAGTRMPATFEGAGLELIQKEREDRESRNAAFAKYEAAHLDHLDERKAIDALTARRAELERQFDD